MLLVQALAKPFPGGSALFCREGQAVRLPLSVSRSRLPPGLQTPSCSHGTDSPSRRVQAPRVLSLQRLAQAQSLLF